MASIVSFPSVRSSPDPTPPHRILLHDVPWTVYVSLRDQSSNQKIRMAYDRGNLELMSPSQKHEEIGSRFGLFLMELADVLQFKCKPLGATTWKKPAEERGKEADQCYYLAHYGQVRGKTIDLEVDPPPDLAVEVEVSRSAVDALAIYAAIRVPEVWRFDGTTFQIHILGELGAYQSVDQSLALPFLRATEVVEWMKRAEETDDDVEWKREVRAWARRVLVPRLDRG